MLYRKGCRALIFVECVPITQASKELASNDVARQILEAVYWHKKKRK